jgi:Uma2 family endonuclease
MCRKEREPTGGGSAGWLEGAPDVAVEVMGDDQSASDLAKKAQEYLTAGAKRVWVLDPDARRVIVYSPPNLFEVLEADATLDGGDALPGFSVRVADLFD